MSIKVVFLLLVGAAPVLCQLGPGEFPFSKSFDLSARQPTLDINGQIVQESVDRHPVCASEESFFKKDLSLKQNLGKDIAFRFKGANKEYFGVDTPFSHEANAESMLMVEEEDARDLEERRKLTLAAKKPTAHLIEKASSELERAETSLQSMVQQLQANPNLAHDLAFSNLRSRLLVQQSTLQKKVMMYKDQAIADQQTSGDADKEELEKVSFDLWYINMNKSESRKTCFERQLKEAGVENPLRYPAVELRGWSKKDRKLLHSTPPEKAEKVYLQQLNDLGYGDCVEGGIDMEGTGTHGSQKSNEWHIRNAVVANYCGHKRLLKEQENNPSAAEYIVVMEDDVIVDRGWFKIVIEDFMKNFDKNKKWSMVQLDPFGYKSTEDFVGHFRGKPVWKPQFKAPCSQYWGFQAVIFRKSALPEINKILATTPAFPIDWLQYKVDNALAFSSLIARNPESLSNGNWVGENKVILPSFCAKTVMKSTIARQKITENMFN